MTIFKAFLPHRTILEIQGEDRTPFLQGLITNDVTLVNPAHTIYTALLTPQGRFLADFFISEENNAYFLEAEASHLEDLQRKLSLYKLRSRVNLSLRPDLKVYALWGEGVALPLKHQAIGATQGRLFRDPRLLDLGLRGRGEDPCPEAQLVSNLKYTLHRLKLGVPEASEDLIPEKSIPLESGLDELHAINWTKGCYMGQELTARTKHQGLVRKRLIPVKFSGPPPSFGTKILNKEQEVGEMRSALDGYGIALLRLEALQDPKSQLTCNGSLLTPFIPPWMNI